jgi:ubiquinone/menaquinone biosynthesis C-methylase UbiE
VADLRGLLRCPDCRQVLTWGSSLECVNGHRFAIEDGVPIITLGPGNQAEADQHAHQRAHYDREFSAAGPYRLDNWQRAYLRRMDLLWEDQPEGGPFLDCGAGGSAYTVIETARRGIQSVACDLSLEGMKRARRYAIAEGVADRCLFVVCGAEHLPFADGSFAAVASIAVLEHIPDDRAAIAELARVTAPQGRVMVAVPNSVDKMPALLRPIYRWHDRRVGHLRHYTPDGLVARFRASGLEPLRTIYSAHWVKVWQLGIHLAASRLKLNDTGLWWRMEEADRRAADRPNGMHLSLLLSRRRASAS